jgi:hypothetical protein
MYEIHKAVLRENFAKLAVIMVVKHEKKSGRTAIAQHAL